MQITSGKIPSNGVELFYEERGPQDGEPILFVMGLSAQMVFWPEKILNALAEQGYRVIRFDNRDVGMSTRFRSPITHNPAGAMFRYFVGMPIRVQYTLHDMVSDTVGLLDALNIPKVHLVGASMGGMISQLLAIHHPDRVLSLTSIMSSPNSRMVPPPKMAALKTLVGPRVKIENVEQYVSFGKQMMAKLGGVLPQADEDMDAMFRQSWTRGLHPRGIRQQFMAIMATGSFRRDLHRIKAPTTIIHGASDPLIRPVGGKMSAKYIRDSRLHLIKGMGHDFPAAVMDEIKDSILETVKRGAMQPQGQAVA
ncbi:MAG: alpha/beta hydrolase [Alcanivoracaceae bacterium]|nr:alpha/beta hydrolase [Alcanivoracaceae bacterium]